VRHHPIGAFLAWFFTVGWAPAFTPVVARHALRLDLPTPPFLVASTFLGLLLPVVVITWLADGPEGVRALGRRVLPPRTPVGWYALALLATPALSLAFAVVSLGPPAATGPALLAALASGLLLQTAVTLLTFNVWEETAWMGFVQARLQARHGALLAAVVTAPVFFLGHLAGLLESGSAQQVVDPLVVTVVVLFRALLAWLYNRTGGLLLVGLAHAAVNAVDAGSWAGAGFLPRLYEGQDIGSFGVLAGALIGLVVIAATRGRLGLPARPARPPQTGGARAAAGPAW
jgi:membrane protease YdiL (CAAX protease family)